jgi:5-oxoprolinase (ATP-hydrolysing)/N-methylhydantoinase A
VPGYRIGIDIGGTFTDFVLMSPAGPIALFKRLTTPHDPAEGALDGLAQLLMREGLALRDIEVIVHGTTLVTNAIIERRGARTALLATHGFRDTLEMGREQRYDIYDLFLRYPAPLVPRRWRCAVMERMSRDGEPLLAPDLEAVERRVAELMAEGVEALAVCFLHSYRNPAHERAVGDWLRARFPQLELSLSADVVPEIREYERTSTTVANAFVQPLLDGYLARLEAALSADGFRGRLLLMQSSGGLATTETARRFPIRLLESGPAGGALVTAFLGKNAGLSDVLAFDMGGTTAKICLIQQGAVAVASQMEAARVHRFKRGSGMPISAPVVEMIEIGAGGGSIARVDSLSLLKVGPESAGADPGPACYNRGGRAPTVTDACLALGYYDADFFLGGTMQLNRDAAEAALAMLGEQLGLSVTDVAWGICQVAAEQMAGAARVHIIEQGRDPRRFPLMAFGGAGPAHAVQVARRLGVAEVIVPPASGAASALGFLVAPVSFDFARSYPAELQSLDWRKVAELYAELETQALELLVPAGVAPETVRFERRVDMRYVGQFHDISVPLSSGTLDAAAGIALADAFVAEYRRLFHAALPEYRPMALNWRLRAVGPEPEVQFGFLAAETGAATDARKGMRKAFMADTGFVATPIYDRYKLRAGDYITGPAIIEERESTTVIRPGDTLRVDAAGNLRIAIGAL